MNDITPNVIREYLLALGESSNRGGVHAHFRAVRAFFNWWEKETEEFTNPIDKVSAPRPNNHPQPVVPIEDVMRLVDACNTSLAKRDEAVLLTLLDTGCRASEFLNLNIEDLDLINGEIRILHGKWDKNRTVYIGRNSRRKIK